MRKASPATDGCRSKPFAARRATIAACTALALCGLLLTSASATAAPLGQITEFNVKGFPNDIAAGADGNLWFTVDGEPPEVDRITPSGQITEFGNGLVVSHEGSESVSVLGDIAAGPDGDMWFTDDGFETGAIGRITPTGEITEYREGLHYYSEPRGLKIGPGGDLWFDELPAALGRITPSGEITEFTKGLPAKSFPGPPTAGPDGNGWFLDNTALGRITPSGEITEIELGDFDYPRGFAADSDGNLWFTDEVPALGRISANGTITEFSAGLNPEAALAEVAPGPEGNVWFTDYGEHRAIGRITPSGEITEFRAGLNPGAEPDWLTAGPDGNLWFIDDGATPAIGRITPSGEITEYSTGLNSGAEPTYLVAGPDESLWFIDRGKTRAVGRIGTNGSETPGEGVPPTEGESSGGGAGGSSDPIPSMPAPWSPPASKADKCRKGYKREMVHKRSRCVRLKSHKHRLTRG